MSNQWSYPIIPYIGFVKQLVTLRGANTIFHKRALSDSDDAAVVRPNVDTLYSVAAIDLSNQDVVVTVPAISGRYYVFPFYDL
jgi:hypothetical protein